MVELAGSHGWPGASLRRRRRREISLRAAYALTTTRTAMITSLSAVFDIGIPLQVSSRKCDADSDRSVPGRNTRPGREAAADRTIVLSLIPWIKNRHAVGRGVTCNGASST